MGESAGGTPNQGSNQIHILHFLYGGDQVAGELQDLHLREVEDQPAVPWRARQDLEQPVWNSRIQRRLLGTQLFLIFTGSRKRKVRSVSAGRATSFLPVA